MELIDQVRDHLAAKQKSAAAAYRGATRAVAAGEKMKPAAVAAVIEAAGKTLAEFTADVREHARRLELQAVADTLPARQAEADAVRAEVADIDHRFVEHARAVEAEKAPLLARQREADAKLAQAQRAAEQLQGTAPEDHPRQGELAAARAERQKLIDRRQPLVDQIARREQEASHLRINLRKGIPGYADQVRAVEEGIEQLKADLADLDARIAEAAERAEGVYREMAVA